VMLHNLVNNSHVLDDFSAFQDCLNLNMKALQSFAMLWTTHPTVCQNTRLESSATIPWENQISKISVSCYKLNLVIQLFQ
jgi:hypothetical protein